MNGNDNIRHVSEEGFQIITIAAFCFAIISWIATASGLEEFVFKGKYWQALMISFSIQSILFVLNLKLPFYLKTKKLKNLLTKFLVKGVIILFYIALLSMSSFFSFVYIVQTVYSGTLYTDFNIYLDSGYREIIYDTNDYLDEYKKYIENSLSDKLGNILLDYNLDEDLHEESLESLEKKLNEQNNLLESFELKYDNIENMLKIFEKKLEEEYSENLLEEYNKISEERRIARINIRTTEDKIYETQQKIDSINNEISNLVNNLLSELLKENIKAEELTSKANKLYDQVVKMINNDEKKENLTNILSEAKNICNMSNIYSDLQSAQKDIKKYINELSKDNIPISGGDVESKKLWIDYWENKYQNLENLIKTLPSFTPPSQNSDDLINYIHLSSYKPKNIVDKMVKIQRNYLADTNQLEKTKILLNSKFNFLAIFSAIFAAFLDLSSLSVGLLTYYVENKKIQTGI